MSTSDSENIPHERLSQPSATRPSKSTIEKGNDCNSRMQATLLPGTGDSTSSKTPSNQTARTRVLIAAEGR